MAPKRLKCYRRRGIPDNRDNLEETSCPIEVKSCYTRTGPGTEGRFLFTQYSCGFSYDGEGEPEAGCKSKSRDDEGTFSECFCNGDLCNAPGKYSLKGYFFCG